MSSSPKSPAAARPLGGPGSAEPEPDNAVIISEANEDMRDETGVSDRVPTPPKSGAAGDPDRRPGQDPERKTR